MTTRRRKTLYDYLMGVADTLGRRYGQYGTADRIRELARPVMGLDPSIIALLDTNMGDLLPGAEDTDQ